MIKEAQEEEIDFGRMARIISRDLSLTYNLMKLVNSAAFGFRYRINNVRHGLVALGEREIKKWIHLIILNDMGAGKPDELTRLSLIRARFMELISKKTIYRNETEDIFLIGLFSLLDVILKKPLKILLDEINTPDIVKDALLNKAGRLGRLYQLIIYYEKGKWDEVVELAQKLKIDISLIGTSYMDSIIWYNSLIR